MLLALYDVSRRGDNLMLFTGLVEWGADRAEGINFPVREAVIRRVFSPLINQLID